MNLYLFAITEHATDERLKEIEQVLQPVEAKVGGVPAWYGSDDEAWEQFASQL